MDQQSTSFRALWPHLNDGGLYVVEDTHTSYWPGFGSGYQRKGSFIELAKNLVDRFHSWYTDQDDIFPHHAAAEQVGSISFYDSMVVFERQNKEMPFTITSMNGNIAKSYDVVKLRNRKSIF